ncbi:MAG: metabolite traffic protein EboE [Acidiferrobacterales bacterium]
MKLGADGDTHLTYCTNIHPGETWAEVRENLGRYLPAIKQRVAPAQDFGVGLRLSGTAAQALAEPAALDELRDFLTANGLYVFTINGFPYGSFHRTRVKEDVYLPDWQDQERLHYTNRLADLLASLLPDDRGIAGSISTVPGAFKPRARSPEAVERIASLILQHVTHLVRLHEQSGHTIALALEPEPCCVLETIEETIGFFKTHLYSRAAVHHLAQKSGLHRDLAEAALRRHLGVCLDLCHAAVEFEDAATIIAQLDHAGVRIAKLQVSAGLRIANVTPQAIRSLAPFDDEVYLHQVVEQTDNGLRRYVDLPEAIHQSDSGLAREWRVHFHVPIFLETLGGFASTQPFVREILAQHRSHPVSSHLEVETYTWDVLPARYRNEAVDLAIARELDWVKAQLEASIP